MDILVNRRFRPRSEKMQARALTRVLAYVLLTGKFHITLPPVRRRAYRCVESWGVRDAGEFFYPPYWELDDDEYCYDEDDIGANKGYEIIGEAFLLAFEEPHEKAHQELLDSYEEENRWAESLSAGAY